MLRKVTLAFANSLLLSFENLILVVFEGEEDVYMYMYVYMLSIKKSHTHKLQTNFALDEKLNTWKQGYSTEAGVCRES